MVQNVERQKPGRNGPNRLIISFDIVSPRKRKGLAGEQAELSSWRVSVFRCKAVQSRGLYETSLLTPFARAYELCRLTSSDEDASRSDPT